MARTPFHCDFMDGDCDRPDCKRTFCVLAAEEQARASAALIAEADEVRKEAERLVEAAFTHRHHKPTDRQVLDAIEHNPEILDMARKRLAERKAALGAIRLNLNL